MIFFLSSRPSHRRYPFPKSISKILPGGKPLENYQSALSFTSKCSQNPVPRDSFSTLILNECYPDERPPASLRHVSSHRLSVLFMVFALGTLMDIHRPLCSIEAEEYHTLARACLCVEPVYDNSSLQAVQSMVCPILS